MEENVLGNGENLQEKEDLMENPENMIQENGGEKINEK